MSGGAPLFRETLKSKCVPVLAASAMSQPIGSLLVCCSHCMCLQKHSVIKDLITALPETESGNTAVVVLVDKFTKLTNLAAFTASVGTNLAWL